MKTVLSIEEIDLLNFFGRIPNQLDPDIPWVYNDSTYEATDTRVEVSFAIAPCVKDVRILLKIRGVTAYELNAMNVEDVKYHDEKEHESIEVVISGHDSIWLRIKPEILIHQNFTNGT